MAWAMAWAVDWAVPQARVRAMAWVMTRTLAVRPGACQA